MAEETYHADVTFRADVTGAEQQASLVVADGVDGWLAAVYYSDTKESINLSQVPGIEDAKRYVEDWVRVVHGIKDSIEWIPGPPSHQDVVAKS